MKAAGEHDAARDGSTPERLLRLSGALVLLLDRAGELAAASPACAQALGLGKDALGAPREQLAAHLGLEDPHVLGPQADGLFLRLGPRGRWYRARALPQDDGTALLLEEVGELRQLAAERDRLASLLEDVQDAVVALDADGGVTSWSEGVRALYGWSAAEMVGCSIERLVPPQRLAEARAILERVRRGERVPPFETVRARRDGSLVEVELSISPLHDAAGQVEGAVSISRDVTRRRRSEREIERLNRALQQRVDELQALFDTVPVGIAVALDPACRLIRTNPACAELLGIQASTNASKSANPELPFRVLRDGAEVASRDLPMQRAAREGKALRNVELEHVFEDGTRRHLNVHAVPLFDEAGAVRGALGVMDDITERVGVQQALRTSEEQFRAMFELAGVGKWQAEPRSGAILRANRRLGHVLGRAPERLVGVAVAELVHPEDRPAEAKGRARLLAEGLRPRTELRLLDARGEPVWVELSETLLRDARGEPQQGMAVVQHVDARRRALDGLRLSEERFRSLVAVSAAIVWTASPEGLFLAPQPLWQVYTGQPFEQHRGDGWLAAVHPGDRERVAALWRGALESGGPLAAEGRVWHHGSRSWRHFSMRAALLEGPRGEPREWVGMLADVEDRKRGELELSRSNAELEQFAYVASHDLQEPLRMVTSFAQLLARRYQGRLDAQADEYIHYLVDGAGRMQELVRALLAYSRVRGAEADSQPVSASAVLGEALENLQVALRESGGEVTRGELPEVRIAKSQLLQLLQNLVGNALKFHGDDPARVHVDALREQDAWHFRVRDNGIGIDPRHAERVFQIFQRLHPRERYPGTGIGLSIARKIVVQHGGRMWVESAPGQGATFHFTLPAG